MDSLYFMGRAQFHQLVTHISLHHEDGSPGFRHLGEQCLRSVGLSPAAYTFWNVPMMSGYLGKSVPLDIHGKYVLVDEDKAMSMATSYGVLRYAYLAAAVRAREGGRWRYDFTTMNLTLGLGVSAGFGLLSIGRQRRGWMRRHPIGALAVSFGVCLGTTVLGRQAMRLLGVGMVQAQSSHQKALVALHCTDCLDDVHLYTREQVEAIGQQKVPQSPGMPPPPPEFVKRFEKAAAVQCAVLEADLREVRGLQKRLGSQTCEVHHGLREAGDAYREPHGLPLGSEDYARAARRSSALAEAVE